MTLKCVPFDGRGGILDAMLIVRNKKLEIRKVFQNQLLESSGAAILIFTIKSVAGPIQTDTKLIQL